MKEFSNPREMMSQIGLDLETKAGKTGKSFRVNIRKELQKFCNENNAGISVTQTLYGSTISLRIAEGIGNEKTSQIKREFKDLMERLGATPTGTCTGPVPGPLAILLNQGAA